MKESTASEPQGGISGWICAFIFNIYFFLYLEASMT